MARPVPENTQIADKIMHTISRSVTANEALFAAAPAGLLLEQRLVDISMGWDGTAWNFVLYCDACLTG